VRQGNRRASAFCTRRARVHRRHSPLIRGLARTRHDRASSSGCAARSRTRSRRLRQEVDGRTAGRRASDATWPDQARSARSKARRWSWKHLRRRIALACAHRSSFTQSIVDASAGEGIAPVGRRGTRARDRVAVHGRQHGGARCVRPRRLAMQAMQDSHRENRAGGAIDVLLSLVPGLAALSARWS